MGQYVPKGLNFPYFYIIGDGKINPVVGVLYTYYKDFLLKVGPDHP